jgi:hypothetical protein
MERRTDQFVVRMPRAEIDAVASLAQASGYSLSEYVRIVLRRAMKGSIRVAVKDTSAAVQPVPAAVPAA